MENLQYLEIQNQRFFSEMADMEPDQRKEECLTKFHSVYMNEKSYDCAEIAAGNDYSYMASYFSK